MDLSKQLEYFDPTKIRDAVHVIGLGAIGSHVCNTLAHLGVESFMLYDFDTVDSHNIANQNFGYEDIDSLKTVATQLAIQRINPAADITLFSQGYKEGTHLDGYVFLAVDNIELRKAIVEEHYNNPQIKAMFDFRMGLADAQHYAARWSEEKDKHRFLATMQFTQEEAKEAMPVSACGTTLSVIPTVQNVVTLGAANWINFVKTGELKHIILTNPFAQLVDAF